jgi:hypothetical protein
LGAAVGVVSARKSPGHRRERAVYGGFMAFSICREPNFAARFAKIFGQWFFIETDGRIMRIREPGLARRPT